MNQDTCLPTVVSGDGNSASYRKVKLCSFLNTRRRLSEDHVCHITPRTAIAYFNLGMMYCGGPG